MKRQGVIRTLRIACLAGLFLVIATLGNAQWKGQLSYKGLVKIPLAWQSNYPPLQTDMPYDVLVGYIYFDSLVRSLNVPSGQMDSVVNSIGWDTLKYALKYLYEMSAFDPVAFDQLLGGDNGTAYQYSSAAFTLQTILNHATFLGHRLDAELIGTTAIFDVMVNDTATMVDSTIPSLNKLETVYCTILDTIKGQNFPTCDNIYKAKKIPIKTLNSKSRNTPQNVPGDCIAFEDYLWWQQNIKNPEFQFSRTTLNNSLDGQPWIKSEHEYIVFLNFNDLGVDTSLGYKASWVSISSGLSNSTEMGAYPVQSGIVYDPNNDFGFGTGLTVAAFKAALRSKIQTIETY
jgi:hypothetical protein